MLQDENATQVNDITFVDDQGNPANKVSVELLLKVAEWTAKKNPQQPHASEPPLLARGLVGLDVYAYGVKPLYGGPNGEHFQELPEGKILVWKPHGFLHYWIDEKLNYHECVKETGELAGVQWITQSKFKVELHGPNHYTVKLS